MPLNAYPESPPAGMPPVFLHVDHTQGPEGACYAAAVREALAAKDEAIARLKVELSSAMQAGVMLTEGVQNLTAQHERDRAEIRQLREKVEWQEDVATRLGVCQGISEIQLTELNRISEALGTNEGHSSVDHVVTLKTNLNDAVEWLRRIVRKGYDNEALDSFLRRFP